ncbi:MAG: dephospho-CoA kinase [Candidatus Peregrinibacteria bacterium]
MVLGITGISGSGKHTAAEFFAQKQWKVLDVDKIAHYLYRPYTHVWKAIVEAFGENIVGQNDLINRQKLSQIVFDESNPKVVQTQLKKLNAIVHPAIGLYLKDQLHRQFRRGTSVVIVAALWKELDLPELCDKILLIRANPELAFARTQKRDGLTHETYQARIRNQSEPPKPDFVIENKGTLPEFYKALNQLSLNG